MRAFQTPSTDSNLLYHPRSANSDGNLDLRVVRESNREYGIKVAAAGINIDVEFGRGPARIAVLLSGDLVGFLIGHDPILGARAPTYR